MTYLQSMRTYFINGNILYGNVEIPRIEVGDQICYDKKIGDRNGRFQTLYEFKNWMSQHFEFLHVVGEEYPNGICLYKILSIQNEVYPEFRSQIFNHSIENYSRLLNF